MRHDTCNFRNTALAASALAFALSASAAVPVRWDADAYRVKTLVYDCYHGETLDLAATLTAYGDPIDLAGKTARLWWQTNGMDAAWWATNAEVRVDAATGATNVLAATWRGSFDTGADEVRGFIGVEGENYRAAFALRLRPSPGFAPSVLPIPVRTIDWGAVANERADLAPFALKGGAGGGVTATEATNIAARVVTNGVAPWALAGQARPVADLTAATNYTDSATAALSNATWTALGGKLTAEYSPLMHMWRVNEEVLFNYVDAAVVRASTKVDALALEVGQWSAIKAEGQPLPAYVDSEINAATNGLYSAASGNALAAQVATIGAHLNAEDAQFIVTNYNSVAHMPEASFKIKLPDQSWSVIWNEMTRFNWLTNVFLPTNYATKAEVEEKADRAWGYFDSHSGLYAPDGYTWISSPRIAIAADLAYQRIVTSAGNVWVLCSHGMVTETGGDTNGYFRISDNKGNTAFEIVAGEERLIGAPATNVTVAADTLTIEYPVNAKPTIEVCASLTNHLWKAETDGDCIATVTWSGQAGAWIATVAAKQSPQPQMFVQASYKTGGETIVRNSAPVSLTHVYIGGTKYAVGTASVGGHTVMTLTPAN